MYIYIYMIFTIYIYHDHCISLYYITYIILNICILYYMYTRANKTSNKQVHAK